MSAIDQIAFSLNRRDEVPNQVLARELAENEDLAGTGGRAARVLAALTGCTKRL